jgi:hypothetical protein
MNFAGWKSAAFGIVLTAALSNVAFAQATRTWVSGVGDDANPCSRTAPCKTLAGAISKTAAAGEINILDPGGFGGVTITKSITIYASGSPAGVLVAGTNGITVSNSTGSPMTVVIRGLNIDGLGATSGALNGIQVVGSSPVTLRVENTMIYGFGGNGINVASSAPANVTVTDSRISECWGASSSGINADATGGAVNLTVVNSYVYGCPTGLNVLAGAKANARNSDFSQNTTGVMVSNANSAAFLDSSTIAFCTTGVNVATTGATARLSNMTITDNSTGLAIASGGSVVSFSNNRIKSNTVVNGTPTSTLFMN